MNDIKKRGFASMTPELRKQIASKGGKAAHEKGSAHRFSPEEAREAGRKGGLSNVNRHRWTQDEARAAAHKSAAVRPKRYNSSASKNRANKDKP